MEDDIQVQIVENEEDFFEAASACSKLYFLRSRHVFFHEIKPPSEGTDFPGITINLQQSMEEVHDQQRLDDNTGGSLYDAAILLSRYMFRVEAGNMNGFRVLELGAGPGLVSMVAAMLSGPEGYVVATDGNSMVVQLAAQNFRSFAKNSNSTGTLKAARFKLVLISTVN
jgi:predicted nicotinamide N-methyase